MTNHDIYAYLRDIAAKPDIWCASTAAELWTDEHISRKMLEFHLDAASEPASRPHDFIDRSAQWIAERFEFARGIPVADFGCGPGLYASRYSRAGARVTGIDFSPRSIAYARNDAERQGLPIRYIEGNYLETEIEGPFDLITLIYGDYAVLSPEQRRELLRRMRALLSPGGHILFDVFTTTVFAGRIADSEIAENLMDGFWSTSPYVGIRRTWTYPEQRVVLDRYAIVEPERIRSIFNWFQYFDREALGRELTDGGFDAVEWYTDVAGTPYSEDAPTLAVIARPGGSEASAGTPS